MRDFDSFKKAFKSEIDIEFEVWFLGEQRKRGDVFIVYVDGSMAEDETEGEKYYPEDDDIVGFCVFTGDYDETSDVLEGEKEYMWDGIFNIFWVRD